MDKESTKKRSNKEKGGRERSVKRVGVGGT